MKLVRARSPIADVNCRTWSEQPLSSTINGPENATFDTYSARLTIEPGQSADEAFERVRSRLLAYDIFPPRLVVARICPSAPVANGATIVQRLLFGPIALEMAVRVVDVWDRSRGDERDAGFHYVTVVGHAERGVASFAVRHDRNGHVHLMLDARSAPGSLAARLGRPVARVIQRGMTRAALRRLSSEPR